MPQDFDQLYDNSPPQADPGDPQAGWTKVYPIFMRGILKNASIRYTDTLIYIASSEEMAVDWCKRNTDIDAHDDSNWWWFVITQEAIDGEYSGIKGVMQMLDWDGSPIASQPLKGYPKKEEATAAVV